MTIFVNVMLKVRKDYLSIGWIDREVDPTEICEWKTQSARYSSGIYQSKWSQKDLRTYFLQQARSKAAELFHPRNAAIQPHSGKQTNT